METEKRRQAQKAKVGDGHSHVLSLLREGDPVSVLGRAVHLEN